MENPSINEFMKDLIKVKKKKKVSEHEFVDHETGEIRTSLMEYQESLYVDRGKFFKLFLDSKSAFKQLNFPAVKVLFYIMYDLREGQHEVYLEPKEVMEEYGWKSPSMFYTAIAELYKHKFLFKNPKMHHHFINVSYFFNGVRTKLMKYNFSKPVVIDGKKVSKIMYMETIEDAPEKESKEIV